MIAEKRANLQKLGPLYGRQTSKQQHIGDKISAHNPDSKPDYNTTAWLTTVIVQKGTFTGISDTQEEGDRTSLRITIKVKRGSEPDVVLGNLYKHS